MTAGTDPAPWRHASGARTGDPRAPGAPAGGYTYDPRHGYDDHTERYQSTHGGGRCARCPDPDPAAR